MANEHGENEHEATFGRENKRKAKKEKKNWRFAYDLYCKELISGNQPPPTSSHRSNPSQEMSHRIRSREKSTNLHPPAHQNLLSQTTYVRHTATSNSVARREAYTKGNGANPGRESRNPSPSRASKGSRVVQNTRSMQSSCRRQIKTAAGSGNQRVNRSKASRITHEASRVATANADLAVASRELSNESLGLGLLLDHSANGAAFTANNPTSNINLVEYPIPPEQPIVSSRHDEASAQLLGNLPSSLGASPDRHDIIAFGE